MSTPDHVNGCAHLHEIYALAKPDYTGRVTVPVLWDRVEGRIASNNSAEIQHLFKSSGRLAPVHRRRTYSPSAYRRRRASFKSVTSMRSGVYAVGGAADQSAYETAVRRA